MSWGKAGILAIVILILSVFIVSTSVTAQTAVTAAKERYVDVVGLGIMEFSVNPHG